MIETVAASGDYGAPASPDWRLIDWPAHEHDLPIRGRRVHYVDIGEGPLEFVLVHGMGGCWQHWSQTLPVLAQHGRAIALDLPGFGRSQSPADPVSLDAFADIAAELCRAVGLEHVIFFGHSMGGPVALRFASRHPDLAQALVLVAGALYTFTALLGLRDIARHARERPRDVTAIYAEVLTASLPVPQALKRLIVSQPLARQLALWPYMHRPNTMPADTAALLLHGAGAHGVVPTARAVGRSDPCEGLAGTSCPILSIGARYDHIVPPADIERFDRSAPTATSVLIEGAGHMVMLERPQVFNTQIERFLTALPPAPHRSRLGLSASSNVHCGA